MDRRDRLALKSGQWREDRAQWERDAEGMVRNAAVLGLTRKEQAACRRILGTECETCEIGQTPRHKLKPFRYVIRGVIRQGWKCPCQRVSGD